MVLRQMLVLRDRFRIGTVLLGGRLSVLVPSTPNSHPLLFSLPPALQTKTRVRGCNSPSKYYADK
jgi:hypothetical protein